MHRACIPFLILAILLGFSVAGCGQGRGAQLEEPPALERHGNRLIVPVNSPLRKRLHTEPVELRTVRRHFAAPATVEADPARAARITPPLAGRVVRLFVHFGESVQKGAPLLALDSPDLVASQTDYLRAKSALGQAERTLARQKDLFEHGIGAQRELEQAQTERDLARSELQRAEIRLHLLGIDPGHLGEPLMVRSPINGRVIEFAVAPGEFRNDLSVPLMTVADLSIVWVTANVQEKDIRRVRPGQDSTATFAAYPGESFPGKVLFVGDLLDPETRTIKVRIAFTNPNQWLKPGMFATVTFTETAAAEVLVPTSALVLIGDKSYVFVVTAPFTFERRSVEAGEQIDHSTIITSGLSGGEHIVTRDALLLQ